MDPCLDRIQDSCLVFLILLKGEKDEGFNLSVSFFNPTGKCPDVDSVKPIKAFSKLVIRLGAMKKCKHKTGSCLSRSL